MYVVGKVERGYESYVYSLEASGPHGGDQLDVISEKAV